MNTLTQNLVLNTGIKSFPFYIGQVITMAGDVVPDNCFAMNGDLLLIDEYPELFAILGVTYGGDGVVNFRLPNVKGRTVVSKGNGMSFGASQGVSEVTIDSNQLPSQSFTVSIPATDTEATTDVPSPSVCFAMTRADINFASTPSRTYSTATPNTTIGSGLTVNTVGGNNSVNILNPSIVFSMVIVAKIPSCCK